MAWTTPASYSVGEIVTASKLNLHIRDNLRYLKGLDGEITYDNSVVVSSTSTALSRMRVSNTSPTSYIVCELAGNSRAWQFGTAGSNDVTLGGKFYIYDLTATAIRFAIDSVGDIGIGTASPKARLDVTEGPGGFATFGVTGLSTTPVTVMSSGVNRRVSGFITAWHSGGTGGGTTFSLGTTAGSAIYNDGVNTVSVAISGGQMTIFRGSGSGTFDVTIAFCYQ